MDPVKALKHAEVAERYKRRKGRGRKRLPFAALRIRDLTRLYRGRHGTVLPNTDTGRQDIATMAHHIAMRRGDVRKHINDWLELWAPWLGFEEAAELLEQVTNAPRYWNADQLAWRLRLTETDRRALSITTIGAIDFPLAERQAARKRRKLERQRQRRWERGVLRRAEYEAGSVSRTKPWELLGISRAQWYREGRHR